MTICLATTIIAVMWLAGGALIWADAIRHRESVADATLWLAAIFWPILMVVAVVMALRDKVWPAWWFEK